MTGDICRSVVTGWGMSIGPGVEVLIGHNLLLSGAAIQTAYNLVVSNSGDWVSDPQDNADWTQVQGTKDGIAAPNQWSNGAVIGEAVNRVNNTIEFTLNGKDEGTYGIQDLNGKNLYPIVSSWDKSGPQATINGGSSPFAEAVPAGFTPLNNLA